MGMTIENDIKILQSRKEEALEDGYKAFANALGNAIDTMRKYQQLQADYNARLKADMVAMLEDLDLQIDESAAYNLGVAKVQRLIRDKIDKLKENKEVENGCNN